jgi:NitT/TauT family transport system substrate-binding protein
VVSRALIESNPELVKRMSAAVAKAWIATIKNPQATIDALVKRDPVTDGPLELQRLQWILDKHIVTAATRANGLGFMDKQKMETGLKLLAEGFGMTTVPTVADLYDDRFLPSAADRAIPAK